MLIQDPCGICFAISSNDFHFGSDPATGMVSKTCANFYRKAAHMGRLCETSFTHIWNQGRVWHVTRHSLVILQGPSMSTCHLEAPQAAVAAEIPNFFDPNFNFDEWSGSPVCSTPLSGGF